MLIGSANFSGESVNDNDENALLIDGDGWAAAIVANRIPTGLRALPVPQPYPADRRPRGHAGATHAEPSGGLLSAVAQADYSLMEGDTWAYAYFTAGNPRCRERAVFAP
jgi:phosphatidylserine/phosphatidylglycerophosphate/cardiolipin synthase-like enzyme